MSTRVTTAHVLLPIRRARMRRAEGTAAHCRLHRLVFRPTALRTEPYQQYRPGAALQSPQEPAAHGCDKVISFHEGSREGAPADYPRAAAQDRGLVYRWARAVNLKRAGCGNPRRNQFRGPRDVEWNSLRVSRWQGNQRAGVTCSRFARRKCGLPGVQVKQQHAPVNHRRISGDAGG